MKCPRCGLPMVNGKIPTDRYRVVFRGGIKMIQELNSHLLK